MYRFGFIIEQMLGHVAYGRNLHAIIEEDETLDACWGFPSPYDSGFAGRIPNWTVSAGLQARKAISDMRHSGQIDALFFHSQVTAVLCLDLLRRTPSIVSLDATPLQYDQLGDFYAHKSGPGWLESRKWRMNQACFSAARHLVAWSDWTKESLINDYHMDAEKITVIPPGVDIAGWAPPVHRCAEPKAQVRILFVGGDFERKGGQELLQAFEILRQRSVAVGNQAASMPQVELHLVTKADVPVGPDIFVYPDMTPNSPELKQLFIDSDIFCLPTFGDCLPMVLSEAGASGLPTVTTSVAAIPEIVLHDRTGLIVRPGDVESLADALHELIVDRNERLAMGDQASAFIKQEFDAKKNAYLLIDLLKSVAQEDGRGSRE